MLNLMSQLAWILLIYECAMGVNTDCLWLSFAGQMAKYGQHDQHDGIRKFLMKRIILQNEELRFCVQRDPNVLHYSV